MTLRRYSSGVISPDFRILSRTCCVTLFGTPFFRPEFGRLPPLLDCAILFYFFNRAFAPCFNSPALHTVTDTTCSIRSLVALACALCDAGIENDKTDSPSWSERNDFTDARNVMGIVSSRAGSLVLADGSLATPDPLEIAMNMIPRCAMILKEWRKEVKREIAIMVLAYRQHEFYQ